MSPVLKISIRFLQSEPIHFIKFLKGELEKVLTVREKGERRKETHFLALGCIHPVQVAT